MQVRNEAEWTQQLIELEADDITRKFRDFLVFWFDALDKMYAEVDDSGNPRHTKKDVLSKSLEVAEQTFGYLSIEWIAQMLLVMTQHWIHGEDLYDGLSVIEKRLVDQATAMKILDLQNSASMPTEE